MFSKWVKTEKLQVFLENIVFLRFSELNVFFDFLKIRCRFDLAQKNWIKYLKGFLVIDHFQFRLFFTQHSSSEAGEPTMRGRRATLIQHLVHSGAWERMPEKKNQQRRASVNKNAIIIATMAMLGWVESLVHPHLWAQFWVRKFSPHERTYNPFLSETMLSTSWRVSSINPVSTKV